MKFIVTRKEICAIAYEIEASSREEALTLLEEGEIEPIGFIEGGEYLEPCPGDNIIKIQDINDE